MPEVQFNSSIPLIDMRDYINPATRDKFCRALADAFKGCGFVAVVNAPIKDSTLRQAYAQIAQFFSRPLHEKMLCHNPEINGQRGFVPGETAQGSASKDKKEFLHFGHDLDQETREKLGYPENIWPAQYMFRSAMQDFLQEMANYRTFINRALAQGFGIPTEFFNLMTHNGSNLARALYYPAQNEDGTVVAAEHTDIDLYTILPPATAAGLQLKNADGEFVDVVVPPGAFVLNAGDMLRNLLNGAVTSAEHRVVSRSPEARFSLVYFVHPRPNSSLKPLRQYVDAKQGKQEYPDITAFEALAERLIELGIASSGLIDMFAKSGALDRIAAVNRVQPKVLNVLENNGYDITVYSTKVISAPANTKTKQLKCKL